MRERCNRKYHFQFWTNTLRKLWGGDPVVNTSYFIFDKYNFHFDKCIFHLEVVRVEFHSWESCNRHLVGGHPPWPPTREALTPQFGILSRTLGSLYNMIRIYEEMQKYKNIQIHKYIYHLGSSLARGKRVPRHRYLHWIQGYVEMPKYTNTGRMHNLGFLSPLQL